MGNETKNIIHVTANTWDNNVLKSEKPVLVDFWAEWCGPCRMVGPALEQLSDTMNGKVNMAKLNVDENREIAMKYGIALLFFIGAKEITSSHFAKALILYRNKR